MARPRSLAVLVLLLAAVAPVRADRDAVIAEMEKIQSEAATRTASIGLCFVPLSGEPGDADGYEMDRGLIPASTMKAITTATAMEVLGPDFRFETRLQFAGTLDEEGTLDGDLVIRGGGDPTLGEANIASTFSRWRAALREAGLRKVAGSVVGDASIFGTERTPDTWQWNDMGNYYGAGACGLTFHQNQFYCRFRTPSVGGPAPFTGTDPRLPGVQFVNEMRVGASGSGDQGYIYGAPYGTVYYLRGTVPAGTGSFTIRGSLPDPAFFCARAFTKYLDENGTPVEGEPSTIRLRTIAGESLAARRVVHTESSDRLATITYQTNMKSNNLQAESIHRMVGLELAEDASPDGASRAIANYWADRGIDIDGFYMGDGCGLSRANTVTARQMAMILHHAARDENFDAFYDTLPVAGRSGTLRSIGRGSAADGRIAAKSGTIDRVRNYAGYVNARSGERYAFALFVNNYSGDLWEVKSQIVRVWSRLVSL